MNKTEKLFYSDQSIKEFKVNVVNVIEKNNMFHVALDATAFFPGGGGQPCDNGTIENIKVIDVYEEEGIIYHVLASQPKKTENLKCEINWDRRLDGAEQHLAQHVISGCFYEYFNGNTVGFHLGDEVSTVDIMGFLEEDKIREAENLANEMIRRKLKVEILTPTKGEVKKLKLRRALPKTNEDIRVVKIHDLDINACCGIHLSNTIELQLIKIKRWEKDKGNTRIEYIAGNRAIKDTFKREEVLNKICNTLNAGEDDALKTINNIINSSKNLGEETKKLKNLLSEYETKELIDSGEKVGNITIISKTFKAEDTKYLNKLSAKLVEGDNRVVLFASINNDKVNMIFASSKSIKKIDMSSILKDAITLIDGNGGGNTNLAQGAGKSVSNLENAMAYASRRIKDSL
ncbi:MAG: DHHA1 domain-containing protein [Clostridium sp.]